MPQKPMQHEALNLTVVLKAQDVLNDLDVMVTFANFECARPYVALIPPTNDRTVTVVCEEKARWYAEVTDPALFCL